MYLHSIRLENFRRMRNANVELAADISIFVGANNSGKTSATRAVHMFVNGMKDSFSLFDFSAHVWKKLNELGNSAPENDGDATIPSMLLDLWFEFVEEDLHLVMPILPSSKWDGTKVGMRIEFGPKDSLLLMQRYRAASESARVKLAELGEEAGDYEPWPRSLTDYLQRDLKEEFEFKYYVLDSTKFDDELVQKDDYLPREIIGDPSGAAILRSLIKVDCLDAQRHLSDRTSIRPGAIGRAEDLSRRLSRFYQRNLKQRDEDHLALKALFDSEAGLNEHLMKVFEPTLKRIATLGYPGMSNPKLEIKSALNPSSVLGQDAKVFYALGEGADSLQLPDSYNGLGFKNLIYMVVEILDLQEEWANQEDDRPPLHLIFIEEPEAHLHAQLQQVFIRNVLSLLLVEGEEEGAFRSQAVITTHSPHILYERGFAPIRYFRRHTEGGEQTTQIVNLSRFQPGPAPKDREFLQRYLKLTHCDLFFADAAILVEGNVERLLLPQMIEKEAISLRSSSLSILEVGGAFGHRFKELIEMLGITTLVITDIDSVSGIPAPTDDDSNPEKEFVVPGENEGDEPIRRYGTKCMTSEVNAVTANQTLISWLPQQQSIANLLAAQEADKISAIPNSDSAKVRVAYQLEVDVELDGQSAQLTGRTLEEAFGLENANWCQEEAQRDIGLRLKIAPENPARLALGLYTRVTGKSFDKTKFALAVLSRPSDQWRVPSYIKEGLLWLEEQVSNEVEQEEEAVADAAAQAPDAAAA
jgi:predicted ATP-dependent endonuclease of OLD family